MIEAAQYLFDQVRHRLDDLEIGKIGSEIRRVVCHRLDDLEKSPSSAGRVCFVRHRLDDLEKEECKTY